MILPRILFSLFLNCSLQALAQESFDTAAIQLQLDAIRERDQKTRAKGDSSEFMQYIDSCNLAQVESLISKYGWMGTSLIGVMANHTLWLVIQHADVSTQEKYLPLLQKSVDEGESRAMDLGYLQDRIFMRRGKKQIYGTQIILNQSGGQEFYPIEDEMNVNIRREKIGLGPIEEYAKLFGIEYKLPTE